MSEIGFVSDRRNNINNEASYISSQMSLGKAPEVPRKGYTWLDGKSIIKRLTALQHVYLKSKALRIAIDMILFIGVFLFG